MDRPRLRRLADRHAVADHAQKSRFIVDDPAAVLVDSRGHIALPSVAEQENIGRSYGGGLRKQPLVKRWESETMIVDITRKVPEGEKLYEWYRR